MANKPANIIKSAKKMLADGYVYIYGYKGTKATKDGILTLAKQYQSVFTASIKAMALKKVGKMAIDCSGFVNKAAGVSLGGSSQIKESSPSSWSVSDSSHAQNGMFIWRSGHVGLVEVDSKGKKWIIEAKGTAYDIVRTAWSDRASAFTHYGKIKGVTYPAKKTTSDTKSNPYNEPSKNVKFGQTGNSVRWVQYEVGVTVDGDFGRKTLSAVKAFQKKNGLTVDGIVGKKTRAKLKVS